MQNIKTLSYNPDCIFNRHGVRKTTKKLNADKKLTLYYLEKLCEDDCVVGYTKLKVYSEKKRKTDVILGVSNKDNNSINKYTEFEVKKKKRFYQKITGYLPVGNERFVAVVKNRWLVLLLIPILLAGIILLFNFCSNNGDKPIWQPDLEDISDVNTDDATASELHYIDIQGFTAIVMDKDTGKAKVPFINAESNRGYFTFFVYLEDGTELYRSKMVSPGTGIKQIEMTPLPEGTYKGYFVIEVNEINTGRKMDGYKNNIYIISR